MNREVYAEIEKLYRQPVAQEYFAQDATMSAQAKQLMEALAYKFQRIFNIASIPLATTMAAEQSKASATTLQASLKELSAGLTLKTDILTGELKDILQATIAENVSLIKSIPSEYFTDIKGAVYRSITTGNGLQDLVPFLQKHEGATLRRARTIAGDQTRKAFSNLNFARMEKIGIQEYEWIHSFGSQKPRKLHITSHTGGGLNGRICRIDNPPIINTATGRRGKPGDEINCHCRAVPILRFNTGE
jgi:uncharacterized protein with gpF-like domain